MRPPNHPQGDDTPWLDPFEKERQKTPSSPYTPSGSLGELSGPTLAPPPPVTRPLRTANRRWAVVGIGIVSALVLFLCTITASAITNHTSSSTLVARNPTATSTTSATDTATALATATMAPNATRPAIAPTNTYYPNQPTYTPFPTGTPYPTPTPVVTAYDDAMVGAGHYQFDYHGTWSQENRPDYYATTDSYSNDPTGYVTFTFVGSRVQLIVGTNANVGIMGISLDGGNEIDKDGYSATLIYQVALYDSGPLFRTTHTLKVFVTGTKNTASSDVFIDVDAVKVSA
ncbi:MAG: hypothetical protein H0X24_14800 [Ktedonobacterales bacterium]|nr:hypothetical protein [Ktedonobacterales bacterium]